MICNDERSADDMTGGSEYRGVSISVVALHKEGNVLNILEAHKLRIDHILVPSLQLNDLGRLLGVYVSEAHGTTVDEKLEIAGRLICRGLQVS
jgi:hypothetical protein